MQILEYVGLVFRFAFRGFVLRTDSIQIVLASGIAAAVAFFQLRDAQIVMQQILGWSGVAVCIYASLRVFTAPYFLWRKDQDRILKLNQKIADPARQREERALDMALAERERLLIALTNVTGSGWHFTNSNDANRTFNAELAPLLARFRSEGLIGTFGLSLQIALEKQAKALNAYIGDSSDLSSHRRYTKAALAVVIARDAVMDGLSDKLEVRMNAASRFAERSQLSACIYASADANEDGEAAYFRFEREDRERELKSFTS